MSTIRRLSTRIASPALLLALLAWLLVGAPVAGARDGPSRAATSTLVIASVHVGSRLVRFQARLGAGEALRVRSGWRGELRSGSRLVRHAWTGSAFGLPSGSTATVSVGICPTALAPGAWRMRVIVPLVGGGAVTSRWFPFRLR
jgi:hypothetical protein